jgi:hypothetical protein
MGQADTIYPIASSFLKAKDRTFRGKGFVHKRTNAKGIYRSDVLNPMK